MPNWCSNSITISGPIETIKDLWDSAQKKQGLLEAMVPIGEWEYDTAVEAWGTKWDVSLEGLEFMDNGDGTAYINGWFDSAWSPPIGAYETFAHDMDNCVLEASYYEPGMDFAGFWNSEGGDEYLERITEQCELPEDERSDLFKRLDEEYALVENFEMWLEEENIDIDLDGGVSAINE